MKTSLKWFAMQFYNNIQDNSIFKKIVLARDFIYHLYIVLILICLIYLPLRSTHLLGE